MYRLTLKHVVSAILAVALLVSYAFAQSGRDCGPNSRPCQLHKERCTCP
jgi:hypothetical protein